MAWFERAVVAAVVTAIAACGGSVVVDADDGSGAGGAGASGSGSSTAGPGSGPGTTNAGSTGPGTTGPGSTGTGGGIDPKASCEAICGKLADLGCFEPASPCTEDCVAEVAESGDCQPFFFALLECVVSNLGSLTHCEGPPPQCESVQSDYAKCVGSCGEARCEESPGGCSCESFCPGGHVEATCTYPGCPTCGAECECRVNGMTVGVCKEPPNGGACNLSNGCCSQFF